MLRIDGAMGEGGGQVLRSSLALAMVTGTPIRISGIRAGRERPGLMRQHLTAVEAAAEVCGARVEGATVGSTAVSFAPALVVPGDYRFAIGTAGSTTLILHTLLPALLRASGPSTVTLEGGTHNPLAPPFEHLQRVLLPLLRRMGAEVEAELESHGFYPAGGGRFTAHIVPSPLTRLDLPERGEVRRLRATALLSRLPRHVAERELRRVQADGRPWETEVREVDSPGPGNALLLEIDSERTAELFAGFGEKGLTAEKVADRALAEAERYLDAGVPVGEHLADQLLLPMALARGGSFATLPLSLHARTQIALIPRFLDVHFEVETAGEERIVVSVR